MERQQLEKFTDRAIGTAIASLILVFSLPIGKIATIQNWSQSAPHLFFFVFCLLMLTVFWTAQSKIIGLITKPVLTKKIVWLSRLYFFFLVLLTLSSGWMADNPYLPSSIMLYSLNLLVISLLHLLLLNSALKFNYRRYQLLAGKIQIPLKKAALAGICCYIIAIGVCYINAYVSFAAIIAALCFYSFLLKKSKLSKAMI